MSAIPYFLLFTGEKADVEQIIDGRQSNDGSLVIDPWDLIGTTPQASDVITDFFYLNTWGANGGDGTNGTGIMEFSTPYGVCRNSTGYLFIADTNNDRIQVYDKFENHQYDISFPAPTGLAFDDLNYHLYASSWQDNNITKMYSNGTIIEKWGTSGTGDGEYWAPIVRDINGTHLFISDVGNNRIIAEILGTSIF